VINLVNFMDRGITPGAPGEFATFVNMSMGVPMEGTAVWTGAIFSSFVFFYSIASVTYGHLINSQPAFRLLSFGLCVWVYALVGSGLAYFLRPWTPFAFYWYLLHRALSGVGLVRLPLPYEAGFVAAQAFVAYRRGDGTKRSPLPDFYIGAHAQTANLRLLTRDAARYRTYFPKVHLITPD
jgi:predicted nucleic acid-binding protein